MTLPKWGLSSDEAAKTCGIPETVFLHGVRAGLFPKPFLDIRRGISKRRYVRWDIKHLRARLDELGGLAQHSSPLNESLNDDIAAEEADLLEQISRESKAQGHAGSC